MNELRAITLSKSQIPEGQRYLYDMYRSKWYLICLRYLKNEADADDAFQNGMINIFSKINQFSDALGNFSAWSCKIMAHDCIMFLRKQKRHMVSELNDYTHEMNDPTETPVDRLGREEILNVVQKLPDGYRTIFNMYVIDGFSHKEIGEQLGISEGTSKSQLFKARKLLQQHLEVLI